MSFNFRQLFSNEGENSNQELRGKAGKVSAGSNGALKNRQKSEEPNPPTKEAMEQKNEKPASPFSLVQSKAEAAPSKSSPFTVERFGADLPNANEAPPFEGFSEAKSAPTSPSPFTAVPATPNPSPAPVPWGPPPSADATQSAAPATPPASQPLPSLFGSEPKAPVPPVEQKKPSLFSDPPLKSKTPSASAPQPAVAESEQSATAPPQNVDQNDEPELEFPVRELLLDVAPSRLGFDPHKIPEALRTKIPFQDVQSQLAGGEVVLRLSEIVSGCPPRFQPAFARSDKMAPVALPMDKLFHQLPEKYRNAAPAEEKLDELKQMPFPENAPPAMEAGAPVQPAPSSPPAFPPASPASAEPPSTEQAPAPPVAVPPVAASHATAPETAPLTTPETPPMAGASAPSPLFPASLTPIGTSVDFPAFSSVDETVLPAPSVESQNELPSVPAAKEMDAHSVFQAPLEAPVTQENPPSFPPPTPVDHDSLANAFGDLPSFGLSEDPGASLSVLDSFLPDGANQVVAPTSKGQFEPLFAPLAEPKASVTAAEPKPTAKPAELNLSVSTEPSVPDSFVETKFQDQKAGRILRALLGGNPTDPQAVVDGCVKWEGIQQCAIMSGGHQWASSSDGEAKFSGLASGVCDHFTALLAGLGRSFDEPFTIRSAREMITFFPVTGSKAILAVAHGPSGFAAGVQDKLSLISEEIGDLIR